MKAIRAAPANAASTGSTLPSSASLNRLNAGMVPTATPAMVKDENVSFLAFSNRLSALAAISAAVLMDIAETSRRTSSVGDSGPARFPAEVPAGQHEPGRDPGQEDHEGGAAGRPAAQEAELCVV